MYVLITGANGFLGRHVARTLHSLGTRVVGIDVSVSTEAQAWPMLQGDVTDSAFLNKLFTSYEITHILHCGGISGPHVCNNDPAKVFEINVSGTLNIFELARRKKLPGRIVFVSSSSVYGEPAESLSCHEPIEEKQVLLANEPYGCSKVACESMARSFAKHDGLDIVSLRVSIVYGPGRSTYCGITRMLSDAFAGKPILLQQGCDLPLPWIYIDDLNDALMTALKASKNAIQENETLAYNVTGPGYPTFRAIAEIVQELIPESVIQETGEPNPYAMNARKMSLEVIRRDLDWQPKVTIERGVQALYETLAGK